MINLRDFMVSHKTTIRELLVAIDRNAGQLALVVDSAGRLQRTVTDGDVRRALLDGMELSDAASALPPKTPWIIEEHQDPAAAHSLMQEHGINAVPQLDSSRRPIRMFRLSDFDAKVWLSTPHMGADERRFVDEAFDTNWIAPLGPNVDAFEQEIADYIGVSHAAALSSGTAALHLALQLLEVGRGDIVFCADLTFVASANPIVYQGAEPVFIDCEADSWNMSAGALEAALRLAAESNQLPKAIIVVNLYGEQANMDALLPIAERYEIPLIEDAAESLGATYRGRHSGTFGKLGVFSFNGNKIITTSGGGMLVGEDQKLIERARFLATQAKESAPYYLHKTIGFNYRMSNVLAGIGRGQLQVLSERVAARRSVYQNYKEQLSDIDVLTWFPDRSHSKSTHWLSAILIDDPTHNFAPGDLIDFLARHDIEARRIWRPMHMQPVYAHAKALSISGGMQSARHFSRGICLPSGSNLTDGQQQRAIDLIRRYFRAR